MAKNADYNPNHSQIFENSNRLLTYKEASHYTGYSVSYLRKLKCAGRIPYIQRGRSVRFRIAALDEWNLESEVS